jgi:hypothetical protein
MSLTPVLARTLVAVAVSVSVTLLPAVASSSAAGDNAVVACSAASVTTTIRAFVAAYDRGRVAAADRYFALEPRFEWFSGGPSGVGPPESRLGARAHDRRTLRAYFASRARQHDKLIVMQLNAGYDARQKIYHFGGKLIRSSDDRPNRSRRQQDFKGAAVCRNTGPVLFVWSM